MTDRIKRGHPKMFPCRHPRTFENTTKGTPECRICQRARVNARKQVFRCGHPVTPENTRLHGRENRYRRCRTCDNDRQTVVNRQIRGMAKRGTLRLVSFSPLPLPPRADESPELNRERSYGFPVKSRRQA